MATQISTPSVPAHSVIPLPLSSEGAGGRTELVPDADGILANAGGNDDALSAEGSPLRLPASCARMPVALAVAVPVREFRVRNLLALARGALIETQWGHGEDLPLSSGDVQLAWSEFEVVDTRLAVRVTRLA